jgi:hypothetical protein
MFQDSQSVYNIKNNDFSTCDSFLGISCCYTKIKNYSKFNMSIINMDLHSYPYISSI